MMTKLQIEPLIRIPYYQYDAVYALSSKLFKLLPLSRPIIVLNIGTDRSTGDCLGPLIGTKLLQKRCPAFHIIGTLEEPVHAKNLTQSIETIYDSYHEPFVIAIDAALGRREHIGHITLREGPVRPGAALKKTLPEIGDAHLTGVVNIAGYMENAVLQSTRLASVMNIADCITRSIYRTGLWQMRRQQVLTLPSTGI
ncbi:spore protease YyaC [Paenalkalicoccus suaedae]|uniref:Spore protease YyaC n=1 Tax=Paenalkalicoccus suaedae TaxID=2592382 RepID=A0A859FJX3_9BACI|nr:spore protease YyaC [Paenalkalicoccus suaedae]QKS73107.1 spore protease YyaC [Paenalkalicoccus suaedae]